MNLSFDALFAAGGSTADDIPELELGGHDPVQNGFTVQNLEMVFEGNVDHSVWLQFEFLLGSHAAHKF